jgi:hypothetical protein
VRNALDRARLRQANRLFADALQGGEPIDAATLTLIDAADVRASRVFDEPTQPSSPSPSTARAVTAPPG